MSTLGSASIQLALDRSQFDSDLKKLQSTDAGTIAASIQLDTKDFDNQLKALRSQLQPIFIPVELDTTKFDEQIKKLSLNIDPIKIDLAPNVKDFQEKLKRIGRISPIDVEINIDKAVVKTQFTEIGRYAAEGFAQGFSGTEDAGKAAVDSMVRSVKSSLGIQSPSKVFKEIGEYAIAGLMQGLDSVDESKLKGVVDKVENYFKNSKIKLNLDIDASGISGKVRVQSPISPTESKGDFSKNIAKSIEDGFQKAKPKTNFLGAIFGGLGSLITIPLAGALRGAFEGIGTPLGNQVGTGVAKALQSTLGANIGSLELISQKAVEKSLQAIPAAQSAIVEVIKSNPIGGAVVKQLESLQRTLELYNINLSPQKAVKSLATDGERAVASSSATFTSQEAQFRATKKAKASAASEFLDIANNQENVQKIVPQIKQKEEDLAKKQQKLQAAQQAIAALEVRLQKIAELPVEQRGAAETSIKSKMAEFSEVLAGGNLSIEEDVKAIASLKKTGADYFERLNNQIKLLADLGIEQELSSQSAQLLKSMEIFEQMATAQKSVQTAQGSVKTNAKTSTEIRGKKLTKLTDLATSAKTNLDSAIASPDAEPAQIQKLQQRSAAANKALDLYKLELADPAKEIEKLNKKLTAANEVLADNIQELQTRLTKAIPTLYSNASREVVKVDNLHEIPQQKSKSIVQEQAEYYSEGAILQREQGKKKEQEIKRKAANKRSETELPREYREIVKDVGEIYAGIKVRSRDIPQLQSSGTQQELGYAGLYDPAKNKIHVSNELFSRAQSGTLTPLDISTLTHEIIHAIDYGFGRKSEIDAADSPRNIQPTAEELRIEGGRIEGSTRLGGAEKSHGQSRDLSRTLETNAYIGDLRLSPEVVKRTEKKRAIHNFETEFGRGAPLAASQYKGINSSVGTHYTKVQQEALSSGINIETEGKDSLARQKLILEKGLSELKPLVDKARSEIHVLPTEEIIALQESIRTTLASSMADIEKEQAALQSELEKKKLASVEKISPIKSNYDIWDSPKIELSTPATSSGLDFKSSADVRKFAASNLNAKGVKDLARRMGIDTKNANKEYLLNEISSLSGAADTRGQVAQAVSQLTPDKFLSKSSTEGNTSPSTDASKAIGELKKARKSLADALKIAQDLDVNDRHLALESIIKASAEQEAIAKQLSSEHQLTPAHSKSLGGVKTQLKNISDQAKLSLPRVVQDDIAPIALPSPQTTKQQKLQSPQSISEIGRFKVGKNKASEKIKNGQQELDLATKNFQKLFAEIVKFSGLDPSDRSVKIPSLKPLAEKGSRAAYYEGNNTIALPQKTIKRLSKGNLSLSEVDDIAHESRHAIQSGFGDNTYTEGKGWDWHSLVPLRKAKNWWQKLNAKDSTRLFAKSYKKNFDEDASQKELQAVLETEEDAYAFAAEVAPNLHKNLKNILKPQGSKPIPLVSPEAFALPVNPKKVPLPPAPWEVDPSLDFRNRKPRTTLPPPPPGFNSPIGKQSVLPTPPTPPGFDLPIKVKQLIDKVEDSGELLKIASDIQKDQTKNLNRKIREYDQILGLIEDLHEEQAKQEQALDDKFSPELIDKQRETIRQRAHLSAKLERKYGMEGLAPEILPDRIPRTGDDRIKDSGEIAPSPSIFQGIKDIFKSLDSSIAKRVKKRASQLAIEVDGAIAPSLETQAIAAGQRGDKVEQKQYQKLAKQSRAATGGIAKILETPGELTGKQVKELDRLTQQLEKVYDAIGRPLPSQGFLESIGVGAGGAIGLVKNLGEVVKGFLAFSIGMWAQNFFGSITQECFKAYVELDRLKTSLNFASGGAASGAQNLAFVGKTVDDLKIPLQASIEGFTRLAGATRNSALEGKQTKDLFQGLSEASTVLSLSAEDTSGTLEALSKSMSQGRIGAELFDELGVRIPGVLGIAARAMGTTEEQFNRLKEAGQITTEDFFPKFGRQLHNEFGEAAKGASDNAPSAVFGVQNSFLELQQSIGGAVSPAAMAGLNALSAILSAIASHIKELMIIIGAVSSALIFKLGAALSEVIGKIILTRMAGATLGANFAQLGGIINNSFSAKLSVGIFAVLEVINLLNQAVNTDLVKSFDEAAKAAIKAADASDAAFEKTTDGKPKQVETAPEASSDSGKFADNFLINPIRSGAKQLESNPVASALSSAVIPGGNATLSTASKLKTFGEYEKDSITKNVGDQTSAGKKLIADANLRIVQLQKRTGDGAQLPAIDAQLQAAEQQRQVVRAQIKRDFVDKGKPVPFQLKLNQESQNKKISDLTDKRANISKPFTDDLNRLNQAINYAKGQIEALSTEKGIKAVGGEKAASNLKSQYEELLVGLKKAKAQQEETLSSFRVDPVLAFTSALRQLNLVFAESQEKNQLSLDNSKAEISTQQVAGFKSNKFSGRTGAVNLALQEKEKARLDYQTQQTISKGLDTEVNRPEFQTTLQRLGVSPDASAAKIDDVLKNTTDEGDKGILEKLKSSREQKNKLGASRDTYAQSMQKVQSTVQDFHSFQIDEKTADSGAAIQKSENLRTASIKRSLEAKVIVEEVANEEIAKIQLKTTQSERKNLDNQLAGVRASHAAGFMSAEEFAKKERDLTTQQTSLEKQEAENRIAVQSASLARRLKELEFFNKRAEALTATKQADSTRINKERFFASGLTSQAQDTLSLDQTKVDAVAASDKVNQVKDRIAQNKELYKRGKLDGRQFMSDQYALNLELAQANVAVIDQKIAGEEKYREVAKHQIVNRQTLASTEVKKRTLSEGLTPVAQDQAALEQNKIDQKAVTDQIDFLKSRIKGEKNADQEIAALDSQLTDLKIAGEEKYRESIEHNIQRIMQTEENRFKKQQSQLDESKAKLDLYNQSLERTNKLEQSRHSLSNAMSDAAIAPLENKRTDADDAEGLVQKLKDPSIKPQEKAAIKAQLNKMGFGPDTGVTVTPAEITKSTGGDSADDYEVKVKEKKVDIEAKIAALKQQAMQSEQEFQRKSLENDLKRQKIAAQMALYDAQGAQLAAQKSKLEADAALKIAIAKKDPLAIETAQTGVDLANKEIDLSNQRLTSAQANLNDQPELAANATQEQKVTQGTETQNFQAGEERRKRAGALDLVETGEKAGKPISLSEAEEKAGGQVSPEFALPKIDINPMPKLDLKPGENIFDAYQRQRDEMKLPNQKAVLPKAGKVDIPPQDKTAQTVNSSSIQPRESGSGNQFVEALKMANQGIEQRLDALSSAIITLANTPRSLTVQTPNAVDDAAKLMNDFSRGQVVGAGM